jgi:hypothetical protein
MFIREPRVPLPVRMFSNSSRERHILGPRFVRTSDFPERGMAVAKTSFKEESI